MTTRYFALVDCGKTVEEASGLFRELESRRSHTLQYFDGKGKWIERPELLRYLMGADEAEEVKNAVQFDCS